MGRKEVVDRCILSSYGVWIANWVYWTLINTSLTDLHTQHITATAAHVKASMSSLGVAWRIFCFGAHIVTGRQLARNLL
jgi:hypothetical protein